LPLNQVQGAFFSFKTSGAAIVLLIDFTLIPVVTLRYTTG